MKEKFNADSINIDEEFEKISQSIKKPNILICGATGSGKSSFVNYIFSNKVARVGAGEPVTRGIHRYEYSNLNLYDSEGYEIGDEKQEYFKNEIINIIDKYRNDYNSDIENQIHEVWYFISAANKRVTDTDAEMIKIIKEKNIPICVVINQIDNVDEDELLQIKEVISGKFININQFTVCAIDDPEIQMAMETYNEKDKLIEWAINNLQGSMKEAFILSLHNNLDYVKKYVDKIIIPRYIASAVAAAAIPIPFSDAVALMPIQVSMSCHIIKIYGIENNKAVVEVMKSTIISELGKILSKTLIGAILKFIPVAGDAAGAAINGGIAGTLTGAIGYAISNLSYKYSKAVIEGEHPDLSLFFSSEIITQYIKSFQQKETGL